MNSFIRSFLLLAVAASFATAADPSTYSRFKADPDCPASCYQPAFEIGEAIIVENFVVEDVLFIDVLERLCLRPNDDTRPEKLRVDWVMPNDGFGNPKISLDVESASFLEVIDLACKKANYDWSVYDGIIKISKPSENDGFVSFVVGRFTY